MEFERMGWDPAQVPDPQDPQTFLRSKLDWSEAERGDHARMLEVYRRLLRLRAAEPDLAATRWPDAVEHSEQERWLSFRRGSLAVVLNLSKDERKVPLGGTANEVLFGTEGVGHPGPDGTELALPPAGAAIVRLARD